MYPSQFDRIAVRISGRNHNVWTFPKDEDREDTQRTRSFVFLAIASLMARRRGFHEVVVIAENGQMAIHLPLTAGRISAFSTHTAHPQFVSLMATVMEKLLGFRIAFVNPYLYSTKKEVVEEAVAYHPDAVKSAVSCWKASRVSGDKSHCGFCVPCMIRRIALEANGLALDEYDRDLFKENVAKLKPDDDGKRNLMDLAEFILHFDGKKTQGDLATIFPELYNQEIDTPSAVKMYERFAAEARSVFGKYRYLKKLV